MIDAAASVDPARAAIEAARYSACCVARRVSRSSSINSPWTRARGRTKTRLTMASTTVGFGVGST
ncbi:hypothetical protein ACFU9Y_45285 [Streptomyces sp. NPDC057621]|uniref:hypothetical protein n=1 Tax=Streptomyces sp. NPDC057621 TaxID=3346186 RepID=UPI0036C48067